MPSTLARRYAAAERLLRYQARSAVKQRKVRDWGYAMALLATVQNWNKRVDTERQEEELVFNLRALSDYAVSQAPNQGAYLRAALLWSAGVMARRILRMDERPTLEWLRQRAKKDGLFAEIPPPPEPDFDERQLVLPVLNGDHLKPEHQAEAEAAVVGESS